MLSYKIWTKPGKKAKCVVYTGWFLFGVIPLIIRQGNADAP